jgi:hypothetical protein
LRDISAYAPANIQQKTGCGCNTLSKVPPHAAIAATIRFFGKDSMMTTVVLNERAPVS